MKDTKGCHTCSDQSKKVDLKSVKSIFAGVLALVFCPCHLALFIPLLAGTAFGSFLGQYIGAVTAVMTIIFGLSLWYLIRKFTTNES